MVIVVQNHMTWQGDDLVENDVVRSFQMLRVMTFNIRHGRGMGNLVSLKRTIADMMTTRADVIGLQEVDRFRLRSGFTDQVQTIAQALDMYWCYAPCLQSGRSQYGNAILSKYVIDDFEVTTLPHEGERRMAIRAELIVRGMRLQVVNTHLGVSVKEQQRQMPALLEMLRQASLPYPLVIVGDFNMESKNELMKELLSDWQKVKTGQPTFYKGGEIDHIFVSPEFDIVRAWTQPTRASDHHPVIADLRWQYGR